MRKYLLVISMLLLMVNAFSQARPKEKEKPPKQSEMVKQLEDAMKGMSEEEKTEMRKMMKDVMPEMAKKPGSTVTSFTDNKKLVPAKDVARIYSISKKIFTDADVANNTALLYNKLMAKIPASEKTIITSVLSKAKTSAAHMEAAIISFMQGHNHVAMALALKAVQAEPKNVTNQNNLAAILSQSGYPEKAIPYLKKLSAQFPSNSTVLHNLGYAWLNLGEVDTARRFFAYAAVRNPNNPETKLCRGVIEELRGDPKKAADHYVEAFEQSPNPIIESLVKNVNAEDRLNKIDFEKLKSRITIYEYFKKDWIVIPKLGDNVNTYENDRSIQNGYSKMFDTLTANIEAMAEASNAEVEALIDKGETEFIKTMAKENMKGLNMMSMPAVYVNKILIAHLAKWQQDHVMEYHQLLELLRAKKIVMTKAGNNDKCPDYDRKNNEFLAYANPLIRKFHAKKIEEFRVWLNAYCTWSWYITGNPKNTVMTACISWTGAITEMYKNAVADQYAFSKSCVSQNGDGEETIAVPAIPNFTCPAVVSIPIGMDELKLSADAVNFDNNDWNIKQVEGGVIPNVTLSMGVDKNDITEPGKYDNPYVKTGNGSITTSGIGNDEELTPLKKIMDELTPLSKIPPDELAPLNPAMLDADKKLSISDYKKIRSADLTKQLLKEMMKTKCPGTLPVKKKRKDDFWVGLGELELEPIFEVSLGELELLPIPESRLGELELWDDEMQAWINSKGDKRYEAGFKEKLIADVSEALKTSGLQTTINNGLGGLKTLSSVDRKLFD